MAEQRNKNERTKFIANKYIEKGINILPIWSNSKKPFLSKWDYLQNKLATKEQIDMWWKSLENNLAVICGKVSNNLEMFDFDIKGEKDYYDKFINLCKEDEELFSLLPLLPTFESPSGGKHIYFRCIESPVPKSTKLAYSIDNKSDLQIAIETRGEGGYALCYPSEGYKKLGKNITTVPTISLKTKTKLYDIAKSLDKMKSISKNIKEDKKSKEFTSSKKKGILRPGDDFNEDGDIEEILLKHNWIHLHGIEWQRPGKEGAGGLSATLNFNGCNLFYVFSSNALPFEINTAYSKFAVFAYLEYDGDFSKAASQLAKEGFGTPINDLETATKEDKDINEYCVNRPLTQLGNSERLAKRYGNNIRYCPIWKSWFIYDEKRWKRDDRNEIHNYVKNTVRYIQREADILLTSLSKEEVILKNDSKEEKSRKNKIIEDNKNINKRIYTLKLFGRQSESKVNCDAMLKHAQSISKLIMLPDEFDSNPAKFNCSNKTIDLDRFVVYDHRRIDNLSQLSNIIYDKNAQCPKWIEAIEFYLPESPELQKYVQKVFGYILSGYTNQQCLFFLHGPGGNGKSTIIHILEKIMGEYGIKTNAETFISNNQSNDLAIANLDKKRLVVSSELAGNKKFNESLIKDITGEDSLSGRFLYSNSFTFTPVAKLLLYGNQRPYIANYDKGIWRRINLLPFLTEITDNNRNLNIIKDLESELSGILNWMLQGYKMLKNEGLLPPEEVLLATEEYKDENNVIGNFIKEMIIKSNNDNIKSCDLYKQFLLWSELNGEKNISHILFSKKLKEQDIKIKKTMKNNLWINIRFLKRFNKVGKDIFEEI